MDQMRGIIYNLQHNLCDLRIALFQIMIFYLKKMNHSALIVTMATGVSRKLSMSLCSAVAADWLISVYPVSISKLSGTEPLSLI